MGSLRKATKFWKACDTIEEAMGFGVADTQPAWIAAIIVVFVSGLFGAAMAYDYGWSEGRAGMSRVETGYPTRCPIDPK